MGRRDHLWMLLGDPNQRDRVRKAWADVAKVFVVALGIDVVYQLIRLRWVYPGEALIVAILLALAPYLLIRFLITRLTRQPATQVVSNMESSDARTDAGQMARCRSHQAGGRAHLDGLDPHRRVDDHVRVHHLQVLPVRVQGPTCADRPGTGPAQEFALTPDHDRTRVRCCCRPSTTGRACRRCAPSTARSCQDPSPR